MEGADSADSLMVLAVVLPGTGVWPYHKVSEENFKRAGYVLPGIAGIGLVLEAL
jgi:hypothetical protein